MLNIIILTAVIFLLKTASLHFSIDRTIAGCTGFSWMRPDRRKLSTAPEREPHQGSVHQIMTDRHVHLA